MNDTVLVKGQPVTEFPKDLFIPSNALTVRLDPFEGPLDLLLYLIKNQNLDISEISIAKVCEQYVEYIHLIDGDFELIAKYLVMAATMAEIKSRILLPKPPVTELDETDPTMDLIRQLQEYERLKKAAESLDALPREERDIFPVSLEWPIVTGPIIETSIRIEPLQLGKAFQELMRRTAYFSKHFIRREILSVRERMSQVLSTLKVKAKVYFHELLGKGQGRIGVVVTLLALLELMKIAAVEVDQDENLQPTTIRVRDV